MSQRDGHAQLAAEVERVARRLRGLGAPRLARPLPPCGTVADAGRALAQALADAAAGVDARALPEPPARRCLPRLTDLAVGDQVAVTGHDLLAALAPAAPEEPVWNGTDRSSAATVAAATLDLAHRVKLAIN